MWQGFTIALREGIESFLIVALTLSYLKRTGRAPLARAVWAGIAVSAVTCTAVGFFFSQAEKKPLWEGILALTAAALVGSLLVYMKRASSRMKSDMEHRIETRARVFSPRRAFWGVFAFTLLMIMREGLETALLVATAFFQLHSASVTMGLAFGLVAAAAIAFAWSRLGRGVDLRGLLNVSAVFLALFLVQLLLYGVHELSEAGVMPASQTLHDATEILGPDGRIGHLLAYLLAIVPTVWLAGLWWKRRAVRASVSENRSAA
jgi:high-affinity iron transporter